MENYRITPEVLKERISYGELCELYGNDENPEIDSMPEEINLAADFQERVQDIRDFTERANREAGFLLLKDGSLPSKADLTLGRNIGFDHHETELNFNSRKAYGSVHSHPGNTHFSDDDLTLFMVHSDDALIATHSDYEKFWISQLLSRSKSDHHKVMGLVHSDKMIMLTKTKDTPIFRPSSWHEWIEIKRNPEYGIVELYQKMIGDYHLGYKFSDHKNRPYMNDKEITEEDMFHYTDDYIRALAEKMHWNCYRGPLTQEDPVLRRVG